MLTKTIKLLFSIVLIGVCHNMAFAQCGSVDFSANQTTGCAPLPVTFIATNIPSGAKVEWDLGGGFISGKDTAYRFFSNSGKKDVSLRITLSGQTTACTTLVKKDIVEVLPKPVIDLDISDTLFCEGGTNSVTFTDNTVGVSSREWIYDGSKLTSTNKTITQNAGVGNHSINLTVSNSFGCKDFFKKQVGVAVYEDVTVEICGAITVDDSKALGNFTGNVLNSNRKISSYQWSFPNAKTTSSTLANPKGIEFSDLTATYAVKMEIEFEGGCVYEHDVSDFIEPFLSPDDEDVCIEQEIELTNTASDNGRGDFSMGFPGATYLSGDIKNKFKIKYTSLGEKDITYSYKYNSGNEACVTSVKLDDIINVEGPDARAFSNDRSDCNADSALMISNSVVPTTGSNLYTWKFYDKDGNFIKPSPVGPTKDLTQLKFGFPQSDVYTVTLVVENTANGCEDSVYLEDYLRLKAPTARILFDDSVLCVESTLIMEDFSRPEPSKSNPYTYSWVIQHSDSAAIRYDAKGRRVTRSLNKLGHYDITLAVSSSKDCADTLTLPKHVVVRGTESSLSIKDQPKCPVFETDFEASVDRIYPIVASPTYTYEWEVNPSKGVTISNSTSKNTSIEFAEKTCAKVTLFVKDPHGCKREVPSSNLCIGTEAGFGYEPDSLVNLCLGDPLTLFDTAKYNTRYYKWTSDKPGVTFLPHDSARSVNAVFSQSGVFKITQSVVGEGPGYCKDNFSLNIDVRAPEAKFSVDKPLTKCAPQQITFTNESKNATLFDWSYGDGKVSKNTNSEHIYVYTANSITGFSPRLIARKNATSGCTDTFDLNFGVKIVGPTPEFRADTLRGCDTQTVTYFNFTTPLNADFAFDYGDGSVPDSNKLVPHTYLFSGGVNVDSVVYFPTMVATSNGCEAFYKDTVVIYRTPKAEFSLDTASGCRPLKVTFVNESDKSQLFFWDFFEDGIRDSINKDTAIWILDTVGQFDVSLQTQQGVCISKLDTFIGVSDAPDPLFSLSDSFGCDSQLVSFTNLTNPISANFTFDYGDGSPSDVDTIIPHQYVIPATHPDDSIIFYPTILASSFGCNSVYKDTVIIYRSPTVDFDIDTILGCQPLQVMFTNNSSNHFTNEWDLYDNTTIDTFDTDTFSILLDTFGTFGLRMTATYRGGCVTTLFKDSMVEVVDLPVADFSLSVQEGCDSFEVSFTDLTTPPFTDYNFDFGDGNVVSNATPDHKYIFPATSLDDSVIFFPKIVGTRVLCDDSYSDTVVVYKSPTSNFIIDSTFGCQPFEFSLINQSTPIFNLEWDVYNDGQIDDADTDTLKFTIDSVGHFKAALFTEYRGGCRDTLIIDSIVQVFRTPETSLSIDIQEGCDSIEVTFTPNNPLDSFIIEYGNGLSDTNLINPAKYVLPTTVSGDTTNFYSNYTVYNPDLGACSDSQEDTLLLFESPTAGFTIDTFKGCAPLEITFTDTTDKVIGRYWDFDNDTIIDDSLVTTSYTFNPGKQTIGLAVVTEQGCVDTLYKNELLTVYNPPRVSFTASQLTACVNSEIRFNDISQLDTNVYGRLWDFGTRATGDTLIITQPGVTYEQTGKYKVKLTVTDSAMCLASDSLEIEIINDQAPSITNFSRLTWDASQGSTIDWNNSTEADFKDFKLIKVTPFDSTVLLSSTTSINALDPDDPRDMAKYYLVTTDTCSNNSTVSPHISKLFLTGDNVLSNVLRLKWNFLGPNNFSEFLVYRRTPGGAWSTVDTIFDANGEYIDSTACKSDYEYYLEGITSAGATSVSNEIALSLEFDKRRSPLEMRMVTVNDDKVIEVRWERNNHPGQKEYIIDRTDEDGNWVEGFAKVTANRFIDTLANVKSASYLYRVSAEDFCENVIPESNTGSSIFLQGKNEDGVIKLSWNPYEKWFGSYEFDLQIKFGNGDFESFERLEAQQLGFDDDKLHQVEDTPWCYRVLAIQQFGKRDTSFSNTYCDYFTSFYDFPTAFTPNNDGLNDEYVIVGEVLQEGEKSVKNFSLRVYDRWGEKLFESNDPNIGWDGRKNGELVPLGRYMFVMTGEGPDGEEIERSGPIFLLR